MGFVRSLLRLYSFLFHGLFALFLLGLASLYLAGGNYTFRFYIFPWEGHTLAYVLLGLALAGIVVVLMAMNGAWRSLFFLWSVLVLLLILRGYFFSRYSFVRPGQLDTALWLILAAFLAAIGAKVQSRTRASRR